MKLYFIRHGESETNLAGHYTGWAQVNGRNDLTWAQKIDYDIEYINKFNIGFDIKILFKTVGVVLKRKGIAFRDGDTTYVAPKDATPSVAPETETDTTAQE